MIRGAIQLLTTSRVDIDTLWGREMRGMSGSKLRYFEGVFLHSREKDEFCREKDDFYIFIRPNPHGHR